MGQKGEERRPGAFGLPLVNDYRELLIVRTAAITVLEMLLSSTINIYMYFNCSRILFSPSWDSVHGTPGGTNAKLLGDGCSLVLMGSVCGWSL